MYQWKILSTQTNLWTGIKFYEHIIFLGAWKHIELVTARCRFRSWNRTWGARGLLRTSQSSRSLSAPFHNFFLPTALFSSLTFIFLVLNISVRKLATVNVFSIQYDSAKITVGVSTPLLSYGEYVLWSQLHVRVKIECIFPSRAAAPLTKYSFCNKIISSIHVAPKKIVEYIAAFVSLFTNIIIILIIIVYHSLFRRIHSWIFTSFCHHLSPTPLYNHSRQTRSLATVTYFSWSRIT